MVRYSGIQLDTAKYVRIQLDTVEKSGIQGICFCCKMARYGLIQGIHGITRDTFGEIHAGYK